MIDLMLDIETLGRGPGCIVTQVALVPFHITGEEITPEAEEEFTFEMRLSIGAQLARGYTIEPETLEWWMKQNEEVRKHVFQGTITPLHFRMEFEEYLNNITELFKNYRVWSSAPKLDFGCLHALLAQPGKDYPIPYFSERCLRTLKETVKMIDPTFRLPKGFNPHDAKADCKRQIIDAQACYRLLKGRKNTNGETTTTSRALYEDVRPGNIDGPNNAVKRDNRIKKEALAGRAKRILQSSGGRRFSGSCRRPDRSFVRSARGLFSSRYAGLTHPYVR